MISSIDNNSVQESIQINLKSTQQKYDRILTLLKHVAYIW